MIDAQSEPPQAGKPIENTASNSLALKDDASMAVIFGHCLDEITQQINWPLGHGLLVDDLGKRVTSAGIWSGPDSQMLAELKKSSRIESFDLGEGVPGKVWESHCELWLVGEQARTEFANRYNGNHPIQTLFAIPLFVDGDITAILEFFHYDRIDRDPQVIRLAQQATDSLRSFLEQRRWQQLRSFLAAIVESSTDAIIGKDRHGKIISWNNGARIVYGFSEDEALGQTIQLILPDGTTEEEQEIRDVLSSGRPLTSFETVRQHKNGNLLDVSMTISPIRDDRGQLIGSATIERDITPLKRTIRELFDREEKLRLLMEASGEAIYGIDPEGKCTFANRACTQTLGFDSSAELLGERVHELIHHSKADGSPYHLKDCPIHRSVIHGKSVHVTDECFWRQNKTSFPVEYWASPVRRGDEIVGAVVIFEDSTQKIAAERTRAELAAIVESSGDAIIGKSLDGTIKSWNRAATQLYGYEPDEVIGTQYAELFREGSSDDQKVVDVTLGSWSVNTFECQRYRKDGDTVEVGITESAIRDTRGQLIGTASVERDITQRKRREAELEQARRDAEIANRAKSEFVANISHELRTPMNAVLGMLRIALEEPLPIALRDYLTTAGESAESLLLILNDLLDFSRIESGKFELDPEPFQLRDTVENAMRTLAIRAHEKGLEFAFDFDPSVPDRLEGDAFRFRQIIMNLVGNAIKFTETGEVFIHFKKKSQSVNKFTLECIVKDTGIGIDVKDLERVFEPFTQADSSITRSRTGSGLGLAICRELVDQMNGEITVSSSLGQGTEFRFTADFLVLDNQDVPRETWKISRRRTLIVDDNRTNRELLSRVLAEWSVETVATNSAEEAIELLRESSSNEPSFSLAFVDSQMPNMNGVDFIQEIRKIGIKLPVVLMVSPSQKLSLAGQSKKLNIATFLEKPVTRSDMFNAIMTVLKGSVAEIPISNIPRTTSFRSLQLLAAEDTPANQKVIRAILERRGHSVTTVESGSDAVAQVQSNKFDAVLMDIQMPFMDGIQATKVIRSLGHRYASIPIVAMTAHARREDRKRCLAAGMSGYVSKPIDAEKLIRLVERLAFDQNDAPETKKTSPSKQSDRSPANVVNLEIALRRMGNDPDILAEMIDAFLEDSPILLKELGKAINAGNYQAVRRTAHSLKGLAANFEAVHLVKASQHLEQLAKSGEPLRNTRPIQILVNELKRVRAALLSAKSRRG